MTPQSVFQDGRNVNSIDITSIRFHVFLILIYECFSTFPHGTSSIGVEIKIAWRINTLRSHFTPKKHYSSIEHFHSWIEMSLSMYFSK